MELEANGDELDASWPECGLRAFADPNEDAEDGADEEPSLGFLVRHCSPWGYVRDRSGNQLAICAGRHDDLEDEHDGTEPPEDEEPSLGSTNCPHNQTRWAVGDIFDRGLEDCDRERRDAAKRMHVTGS